MADKADKVNLAPIWFWLPGQTTPTHIADLHAAHAGSRWRYRAQYLDRPDWIAPDPIHLGKSNRTKGVLIRDADGLAGVLRDAAPSGYGADRLDERAGRVLSPLERLELGPADGVGALEACRDIEAKLAWRPHALGELEVIAKGLGEEEPSSRAIRKLADDFSTSAGGERPKMTVHAHGHWWLAKMRARGDIAWLPAKEFATMSLARDLGDQTDLRTPEFRYVQAGAHAIFLIKRFDRTGDDGGPMAVGAAPVRVAFASAHTVLGLRLDSTQGDPQRSYLAFADELRRWGRASPWLDEDLAELWRRMVTNALVGNADDHPRNHGLLFEHGHWRLAPLFDVTPIATGGSPLRMAVGADGSGAPTIERMLGAAAHFGVQVHAGARWLRAKSEFVAQNWRQRLRDLGVPDGEIERTAPAFVLAEQFAHAPQAIERAADVIGQPKRRRRPTTRSAASPGVQAGEG